jgi:aldehyde dehydrogenase (NAD+)
MLAWICGNVCIWKPSEKTPLCAVACHHIISEVFKRNNVPDGINGLVIGGREVGEWLSADTRIPLVSATWFNAYGQSRRCPGWRPAGQGLA